MGISTSEVLFSYAAEGNSNQHHIVKARYANISESSFSLNEEYHQSLNGQIRFEAFCLSENNETIWHVANIDGGVVYFQYYLTNFSLVGSKYASNGSFYANGFKVIESGGIL